MKGADIASNKARGRDANLEKIGAPPAHNARDGPQTQSRRGCTSRRWLEWRWFMERQLRRTRDVWLAMTGQIKPQQNVVMKKNEIEKLSISLEVGKKPSLFIFLAADGTVNRLGTGTTDNTEQDMFIGVSRDRLFEQVLKNVPQGLFEHRGAYHIPGKQGKAAELNVIFSNADESKVAGFMFQYHCRSKGPPPEIARIVVDAVNLTEQWYQQQKGVVGMME